MRYVILSIAISIHLIIYWRGLYKIEVKKFSLYAVLYSKIFSIVKTIAKGAVGLRPCFPEESYVALPANETTHNQCKILNDFANILHTDYLIFNSD